MSLNDAQHDAVTSEKKIVVVSAGAGSGKTRVLTERFIYLCKRRFQDEKDELGAAADEIVAITFTDKAAREMKERIRTRLLEKEEEATCEKEKTYWEKQLELLENAYISTFHSFCYRLLSQYALKADVIPNVRVADEVEAMKIKNTIATTLFTEKQFHETVMPLLDGLNKNRVIELIIKTYNMISEFVIGLDRFENLHANDMVHIQQEAIENKKRALIQSFHEKAIPLVHTLPTLDELKTDTQKKHVKNIANLFETIAVTDENYVKRVAQIMPKSVQSTWENDIPSLYELCKNHWRPFQQKYQELEKGNEADEQIMVYMDSFITLVKEFAFRYEAEKERAGIVDFVDQQQIAVSLLQKDMIQKACKRQFRHIMIDEFQDTNRLQLAMLEGIDPLYQFIVGDEKQSIYRFRGADVSLMNEKETEARQNDMAEIIEMNINYRTCAPIIDAVNEIFSQTMASERTKPFETMYTPLIAHRQPKKDGEKLVELTVLQEADDDVYEHLANRIATIVQTGEPYVQQENEWILPSWSHIAILIPARTHLLDLERALEEKNIPYVVNSGVGFYERQEVVDFMTILRWLNRPFEEVYIFALLRSPLFGLTLADLFAVKEKVAETESLYEFIYTKDHPSHYTLSPSIIAAFAMMRQWLHKWIPFMYSHSLKEQLHDIFEKTGLRTSLLLQQNGLQKIANVEKLIETIDQLHETELETIVAEMDEIAYLNEQEGEAEVEDVAGDVVQIMTIHAAKGLEFPIVCLPEMNRRISSDRDQIRFHEDYGIVFNLKIQKELELKETEYETPAYPLVKNSAREEEIEETKRLFYVAMTRAQDYVYMIGNDKAPKNSWLYFLNEAMMHSNVNEHIKITTKLDETSREKTKKLTYTPPTVLEKQDIYESFSVSEIVSFVNDPVAYFYRYVVGLPSIHVENDKHKVYPSEQSLDPSLVGTLVHRATELRDYGFSEENAIYEAVNEREDINDVEAYTTEVQYLMGNYTEEDRLKLGVPIANEWSFATIIAGVEIVGEIDKIVRNDGQITLIDFKTNRINSSAKEWLDYYKVQLLLYKMAYEQETSNEVAQMGLYLFRERANPFHMLSYTKADEEKVKKIIRTMKLLRQTKAGKKEYETMINLL